MQYSAYPNADRHFLQGCKNGFPKQAILNESAGCTVNPAVMQEYYVFSSMLLGAEYEACHAGMLFRVQQ